jgi:hypothetical protein
MAEVHLPASLHALTDDASGGPGGSGDGGRTWRTLSRRLPPVLGLRAAGVQPLASFVGGAA